MVAAGAEARRPLLPVFVVGEKAAGMGAATALLAFQVLTGALQIPSDERGSPPPQTVALFSSNTDVSWQDKLKQGIGRAVHSEIKPILHLPVEAAQGILSSIPEIQSGGISHLGLLLGGQESQGLIPAEMAQSSAHNLQQVLGCFPSNSSQEKQRPFAFVSLSLPLHLAMMQANCLPKSNLRQDTFQVLLPEGGSIHAHYLYDEFGDPLACPTQETILSTPPTFANASRSAAIAAAYSALRGNGMDPISSAAIAAAVATILGDSDSNQMSWSTIQRVVQLSRHIRQYGTVDEPGALGAKWREYGYK